MYLTCDLFNKSNIFDLLPVMSLSPCTSLAEYVSSPRLATAAVKPPSPAKSSRNRGTSANNLGVFVGRGLADDLIDGVQVCIFSLPRDSNLLSASGGTLLRFGAVLLRDPLLPDGESLWL